MLDLSQHKPPLDLRDRIERYKRENSPSIFTEKEMLVVSGMLRRNQPLLNYIQESEESNLFESPLVQLMTVLTQDLSTLLSGFYFGYTATNKFVLIYHPKYTTFPINRDNLISLMCSRAVNFAGKYYSNPMALVGVYQVPKVEVQNVLAYHKMSWVARRNRILGQLVLGINVDDTRLTHEEVLQAVQNNGYSLNNLNSTLRDGFSFSPYAANYQELK